MSSSLHPVSIHCPNSVVKGGWGVWGAEEKNRRVDKQPVLYSPFWNKTAKQGRFRRHLAAPGKCILAESRQSSILHPHCTTLELWTKRVAAAAQSPCCFAVLMATATRLWMRGRSGAHWGGLHAPASGLAPVLCTGGQEAGTGQPNTQIWRATPDGEEFRCW